MKTRWTAGRIVYIVLAGLWFLSTVFPLFFTLISSFKDDQSIFTDYFKLPDVWHFDNYARAESMTNIIRAVFNSLFVSAVSIILILFVTLLGAYVISRKKVPFSGGISLFLIAALMIPIQAAIVPIIQMVSSVGLNNNLLALSVVYAGLNLSMVFLILKNSIDSVPCEIDEAATIDGCGLFQTLIRVITPIVKPALSTCAIISFLFVYNELPISNVLITQSDLKTISQALLNLKGDFGTFYSISFAAIVISIIPTLILYLIAQEKVEKSLCAGSVKG